MKPLKIAVVGTGHLGRIHARLLSGIDAVELVAVVDPLIEATTQVATECNAQALADHRQLLGKIDAAVVAAPTRLHHSIGLDLLGHGIHLLMEKPLAATPGQAEELLKAARENLAVLQVGHIERFNPALEVALPHIKNPKYIDAKRYSGYSFRSTDIGVVLDLMIHDIDLILSFVGAPIRSVEALGVSVLGKHEDVANARLVFDNGCVANLSASRVSYQASRQMQIWSRQSFVHLDFSDRSATLVRPNLRILQQQFDIDSLSAEKKHYLKQHLFERVLPIELLEARKDCNALLDELNDFVESIRSARSPRVTGEHGRDALAVAQQILDKIEHHPWDGHAQGALGPHAVLRRSVLEGPHWNHPAAKRSQSRRQAG